MQTVPQVVVSGQEHVSREVPGRRAGEGVSLESVEESGHREVGVAHQEQRVQGVVIVEQGPEHLLKVPHLLDESVQPLGHPTHFNHPVIHILMVTIPCEGVILVDHITSKVFEVEAEAGDKLIDDVTKESHGEIEGDYPQCDS